MSKGAKQVSFKVPTSKLATGADAWIANRGAEPASDREGGSVTPLKAVEAAPTPEAKKKISPLHHRRAGKPTPPREDAVRRAGPEDGRHDA